MMVRFVHTSDWQIGKVFRFVDGATMGLLQDARLVAITRIGEFAGAHGANHVFVAGDVYDMQALAPRSRNQPIERMRAFADIRWHLMPGNHDHHRPNGLWDQLLRTGLPDNVFAHLTPEPRVLGDLGAALLPAPLFHRRTLDDPTAHMDGVATPDGVPRIGLAHGTVRGFGSEESDTHNLIAPDRPNLAGLAYLALGDWHGQKRIGDRCWYSGTHETDAFSVANGGGALAVKIDGPGATPEVTPVSTGRYDWITHSEPVNSRADIDHLESKLRHSYPEPERVLIQLAVEGALSLADRQYFQERIAEGVSAAFRHLRIDDRSLFSAPTSEDLDRIDGGGFVRAAAEELKRLATAGGEERDIAAAALQRLYLEHMKLQAAPR